MFKRTLTKPDGRCLWLYSRAPIDASIRATAPGGEIARAHPQSHMRWHPLRGEWVAYATHRQDRTFLPPAEFNPLAPTTDAAHPTEVPAGAYDVAVFENRFPTFSRNPGPQPADVGVKVGPATGAAEVVVFTQDANASLGSLPLDHLELLFEVWTDRYLSLGARDDVQYVMPFENRGVEVGVTLHHPHGQIYAYPFIPPVPARELEQQREYYATNGRGLLAAVIESERGDGRRILFDTDEAVAFIPAFARYAYEVWMAPARPLPSLAAFDGTARRAMARVLKAVLATFDALWNQPFPYVMVFHQAPTDGAAHPEAHFHIECYPAYRMRGRLKYLAGSELGAGVFTADTLPEVKARELREVAERGRITA
jgi:UDPglucose--hexose-1-phosphate uridylyltransferase